MAGPRPVGVTILTVIIWLVGIIGLIASIFGVFAAIGDGGGGTWFAVIAGFIISIIYLAVARGLSMGGRGARAIVTIVTVIGLIVAVINMFTGYFWGGIIQAIIDLIILGLLYNASAKAFFE